MFVLVSGLLRGPQVLFFSDAVLVLCSLMALAVGYLGSGLALSPAEPCKGLPGPLPCVLWWLGCKLDGLVLSLVLCFTFHSSWVFSAYSFHRVLAGFCAVWKSLIIRIFYIYHCSFWYVFFKSFIRIFIGDLGSSRSINAAIFSQLDTYIQSR